MVFLERAGLVHLNLIEISLTYYLSFKYCQHISHIYLVQSNFLKNLFIFDENV